MNVNIIIIIFVSIALAGGLFFGLSRLLKIRGWTLIIGGAGTVFGLIIGSLGSIPISKLPDPFGQYLPLVITVLLVLGTVFLFLAKRETIQHGLLLFLPRRHQPLYSVILDTSVLIDGRILELAKIGFLPPRIIVPRFVLEELQKIADSGDKLKREKGRRGLEILNTLVNDPAVDVKVIDEDIRAKDTDAKLVKMGKTMGLSVMTNDFNLNRVAAIEGVKVLNLNELAEAVKPVVVPGEDLAVRIVQQGKEKNQGVGYLPDGTMIVVEGGDKLIGQEVLTEVTRIFQTAAGKMIFAQPKKKA